MLGNRIGDGLTPKSMGLPARFALAYVKADLATKGTVDSYRGGFVTRTIDGAAIP